MSSWYNRLPSWSERISPFGRTSQKNGTTEVSDSDFSYITEEDLARESSKKNSTSGDTGSSDVLILKHKRLSYPLRFPSGSIDRGQLKIGQIRAEAAKKLELPVADVDRIKLLYRGKNLKDDHRTAREEGLSSSAESELMVVVGDAPPKAESSSSEGEAEEGTDGVVDGLKKKKNRKRKGRRKNKGDGSGTASPTTSYTNAKIDPDATYAPSSAPPPRPSAAPRVQAKPQTALEKLDTLSSTFHTKYVPDCIQFLSNPPADQAKRQYDQKRFSETILAQILLKLDAVETEGDPTARQRRKDLVREVQDILNRLDEVGK